MVAHALHQPELCPSFESRLELDVRDNSDDITIFLHSPIRATLELALT